MSAGLSLVGRTGQKRAEQSREEQNRAEQNRAEQNRTFVATLGFNSKFSAFVST